MRKDGKTDLLSLRTLKLPKIQPLTRSCEPESSCVSAVEMAVFSGPDFLWNASPAGMPDT